MKNETNDRTCEGLDKYEIECWLPRLGSFPIRQVIYEDRGESYEMKEAHVYELENGQYALIIEEGCSCYDRDDAQIDLFPNQETALIQFFKWQKNHDPQA